MTIVGDDKRPTPMPLSVREGSRMFCNLYGNCSLPRRKGGWRFCYTLHRILVDANAPPAENDGGEMVWYGFVGLTEANMEVRLYT